jgi:hypothetical protein
MENVVDFDVKVELKREIETWVKMKKEADDLKRRYDEIKTQMHDKNNLIKQYMIMIGGEEKQINCSLEDGKWALKLNKSAPFKCLSKKRLCAIVGDEHATEIWNERERKEEQIILNIKHVNEPVD